MISSDLRNEHRVFVFLSEFFPSSRWSSTPSQLATLKLQMCKISFPANYKNILSLVRIIFVSVNEEHVCIVLVLPPVNLKKERNSFVPFVAANGKTFCAIFRQGFQMLSWCENVLSVALLFVWSSQISFTWRPWCIECWSEAHCPFAKMFSILNSILQLTTQRFSFQSEWLKWRV